MEFGLPGDTLPTAASVRRALEQEFPGARVRPSAVTDDGRTLALSVDGVTIRITATGRPYTGTVRTDGFTLPAPADSVADAALTLATATGQDSRGRDLLDLLWALRATSADGTPSLTPATLPEDAYRAARPAGAPRPSPSGSAKYSTPPPWTPTPSPAMSGPGASSASPTATCPACEPN